MNQTWPSEDKTWALFAHLGGLCTFIGFPVGHILVPLVIWLIKRDTMPFVKTHALESLNFQISMLIYGIIAGLLIFILIGYAVLAVLFIFNVVVCIQAAMKANAGETFEYPLNLRLVKTS